MSTISVVPAPGNPLTDSQSAYNTKTLAFAQALPTLGTEINTVVGEIVDQVALLDAAVDSASESADAATTQAGVAATQAGIATTKAAEAAASALSAINSPGTSATSTTSLTIGDGAKSLTVQTGKSLAVGQFLLCAYTPAPENYMVGQVLSYNSGSGALTLNIVYSGGSGTYAAWTLSLTAARSGAAEGGADITVSATGFSLLASSGRVQSVTFTAANQNIVLPDATTLATGGEIFVINNTGAHSAYVRKPSGSGVVKVPPNTSALLYLSDNTTADGVWASGLLTQSTALALGTILTVNSAASNNLISITALSPTSAIVVWREAGPTLKACVLTVSNSTVSAGPAITVDTTSYSHAITALTSTTALLLTTGNGTYTKAAVLTAAGTNLSVGAVLTVNATKGSSPSIARLSDTGAVASYLGTGDLPRACVLTVAGTTVSAGPEAATSGVYATGFKITPLDATHCCIAMPGASASGTYAVMLTVSGTTVTAQTGPLMIATYGQVLDCLVMGEGTMFVALVKGANGNPTLGSASINAYSFTAGQSLQIEDAGGLGDIYGSLCLLSPTQATVVTSLNTPRLKAWVLNLADGTLAMATSGFTYIGASGGTHAASATLSDTRTLTAFAGVSTFLQSVITEVL